MYPYRHPLYQWIYQRQSFSRIVFRILAVLALVLFFLMTYEPARCQTPRNPNITSAPPVSLSSSRTNQPQNSGAPSSRQFHRR